VRPSATSPTASMQPTQGIPRRARVANPGAPRCFLRVYVEAWNGVVLCGLDWALGVPWKPDAVLPMH
jgi:hypothetical protein